MLLQIEEETGVPIVKDQDHLMNHDISNEVEDSSPQKVGKRAPDYNPWAGKRTPDYNPWTGKKKRTLASLAAGRYQIGFEIVF